MWLIAIMCLLMVPVAFAALVWLLVAAWRALDALLRGTIDAVCITWRVMAWTLRVAVRAARSAHAGALHLRQWHAIGSTWAGQYLQTSCLAWSSMLQRRYIASQLRRMRRTRRAHE